MNCVFKKLLSFLLCLALCSSMLPSVLAAPQRRGTELFSDSWVVNGKAGSAVVEKTDGHTIYFEIRDARKSGHWEIELYFSTGAILSLNSDWSELELYAGSLGMDLMLAASTEIEIQHKGDTDYGWVEIPSEWDEDVSLKRLQSGGVILVDGQGNTVYCSEDIPSFGNSDIIPANSSLDNGVFYATLWSAERVGKSWNLHLTLNSYDLYSDSYVRSLRVGDDVNVVGWPYRVVRIDSSSVLLEDGFSLVADNIDWAHPDLVPDGYWVVSGPSGLIVQYELEGDIYPTTSRTRYIDNTAFDNTLVSTPLDLFTESYDYEDGVPVILTLQNGTVTQLERYYIP